MSVKRQQRWRRRHPKKYQAGYLAYSQTPQAKALRRQVRLKARFGITVEEYDQMHTAQGGLCAVCQRPETRTIKGKVLRLAVDHNHETGKVRGLLCSACNSALGLLKEDPLRISALGNYVKVHQN